MTGSSIEPHTHRVTFDLTDSEKIDVDAVIMEEGLDSILIVEDDNTGKAILLETEK